MKEAGKGCPKFVFVKLNEVGSFDSSATSGNASKDEACRGNEDVAVVLPWTLSNDSEKENLKIARVLHQ